MADSLFYADLREQSVRSKTAGSWKRFQRARKSLAGGVSSAVRRSARPYPLYFVCGDGSRVTDVDSNTYIDYGLAWGPLILGHTPREVGEAIEKQLARGLTFGAQHELEFEVAEKMVDLVPCADAVCFANSGTEIVQSALRLARAVTGRQKHLKFEGHYHGWDDSVLVSYKPTLGEIEASGGKPVPVASGQRPPVDVVVAQWNDQTGVEQAFDANRDEISAVICEPLLCNSGCIPPEPGFLQLLRHITSRNHALLIFDEVITGFRLQLEGAQGFYGVTPDLATYAKAIGGGTALSALAGRNDYMQLIASGTVIHTGTLNGNPLSLAAANATLQVLSRDQGAAYQELWRRGECLREGLESVLREIGLPVVTSGGGPVFQVSFMEERARTYRDTLRADTATYSDFALALLDEGVLVLPDGRWYVSTAHTDLDIEETLAAARRAVTPELQRHSAGVQR